MIDQDGRPAHVNSRYSREELVADGVIHALGVTFALAGAVALIVVAVHRATGAEIASIVVYAVALLAVLGISAAYNLWPATSFKWLLRRFDHSAIYLLIAGTYTPFLVQLKGHSLAVALLVGIWVVAAFGIALKLFLPGRLDRLSIAVYLLLGWSGVAIYDLVIEALPVPTLVLLATGGILYTVGVVFHAWHSLKFQNAVWHAFVLVAAVCHYAAVFHTAIG